MENRRTRERVSQGSGEPGIQGSREPGIQGSREPGIQGSGEPGIKGSGEPVFQGRGASTDPRYSFRNLDLWNRAQDHAARVIKLTFDLPQTVAGREIGRQLVRAAGSIGANIAEGHGRYTIPAYRNHLSIAKGSASEVGSWLDLLRRIEYIDFLTESNLRSESSTITGALVNRMRALENQARELGVRLREEAAEYYPGSYDGGGDE